MATQLVRVNHIVLLNVKNGALVTVVARDRSFDLLLQVQRNVTLGGSYSLKAKVPVGDPIKIENDANAEKNEDGYVYLPVAVGTFDADFDSTGINLQDLPAFEKSLPVYMFRFSASSNDNDIEFTLDDVKHENDSVITLSFNETFRQWRPGVNRTAAINMAVTRLLQDPSAISKAPIDEQIELAYAKRIQLESPPIASTANRAMKIVAAPTPAQPRGPAARPAPAAPPKTTPSPRGAPPPAPKSAAPTPKTPTGGVISSQKVMPNVTRVANAAPQESSTDGKRKIELRELVVQLQRVGENELARYGIERPAPRSSKSERQIKRRRYDVDDEADGTALQPGPFKCGYCPAVLTTSALLIKHVKVVHKLICSLCNKKFPSVAQAREHYRECATQLNDSLSRKSVARNAVQRVAAPQRTTTTAAAAAQKLGGAAFVGAQKLTAAAPSIGKLSLTPSASGAASGSLLGSKLLSRSAAPASNTAAQKATASAGAHLAKLEAATCTVCKRVCKTVPGLKSHVQQAHRTMYFAVLLAIYRRCAAAQQQSASTLDAAASDKQPAFTIENERFFYDPKNDELRTSINSFFEEMEAEKEGSVLFSLVRELDADTSRFVSLVKTIEDRYAPFGESRRAIWNFLDVERLMRALTRADPQAISDIMKAQRAASMTLSGVFDDVAVGQSTDATTKPKSPVKRPLEESNASIKKRLSDDDDSTIEFDEDELESAGPEVSRLVKEGPSGFLARCARLEDGHLKCAECQKEYPNEKAILKHRVRVHISKLKFRCSFCDHASCDRHALEQHMLTHAKDGQTFECPECATTFDSRAKLTTHLTETNHRPANDDENVLHKCPFNNCGLIFKTRGFLNGHVERSHAGEPIPQPKPVAEQTGIAIGGVRRSTAQTGSANVSYTGKSLKKFGVKPGSDVSQLIGGPPTNQKPAYKQPPPVAAAKVKVEEVLYRCSVCEQLFNEKDTVFRHQDELLQAQTRFSALGASATEPHTLANSSTGAHSSVNPLTENDIQYVCGLCDVVFTCECYANQHVRLFHPESDPQAGCEEYADPSAYDGTVMQDDAAMLAADADPSAGGMMEEDAAMYTPMDNAVASNEMGME